MSSIKKNIYLLLLILFLAVFPLFSLAQPITDDDDITDIPTSTGRITNPLTGVNSIPALIQIILEGVLKIGIPIIALAIIYSGFLFVSAQGKPEAITKAKNAFMYTLIGAAILLGSWAIAKLISETVLGLS